MTPDPEDTRAQQFVEGRLSGIEAAACLSVHRFFSAMAGSFID